MLGHHTAVTLAVIAPYSLIYALSVKYLPAVLRQQRHYIKFLSRQLYYIISRCYASLGIIYDKVV